MKKQQKSTIMTRLKDKLKFIKNHRLFDSFIEINNCQVKGFEEELYGKGIQADYMLICKKGMMNIAIIINYKSENPTFIASTATLENDWLSQQVPSKIYFSEKYTDFDEFSELLRQFYQAVASYSPKIVSDFVKIMGVKVSDVDIEETKMSKRLMLKKLDRVDDEIEKLEGQIKNVDEKSNKSKLKKEIKALEKQLSEKKRQLCVVENENYQSSKGDHEKLKLKKEEREEIKTSLDRVEFELSVRG